jgi:hypothetical protein
MPSIQTLTEVARETENRAIHEEAIETFLREIDSDQCVKKCVRNIITFDHSVSRR